MFENNQSPFSAQDWRELGLMAGLSILANNNGRMSTGQLIGQGGLDAMAGLAWRKKYEQEMARKQVEDERAQQAHDMEMRKNEAALAETDRYNDAMRRWQSGDRSDELKWILFPKETMRYQNEMAKYRTEQAEAAKRAKTREEFYRRLGILPAASPSEPQKTVSAEPVATNPPKQEVRPVPKGALPGSVTVTQSAPVDGATGKLWKDMTLQEKAALAADDPTLKSVLDSEMEKAKIDAKKPSAKSEWAASSGELFSDIFKKSREAAHKSATSVQNIELVEKALDNGMYTGAGGQFVQDLRKIGAAFGIEGLTEKASAGEILQSITREMALQLRNPSGGAGMPGALSDADRDYLESMVPGLTKTPEGNRALLTVAKRLAQRNIEYYNMMLDYEEKHGLVDAGFDRMMKDYKWANMFDDLPRNKTTSPPVTEKPGNRGSSAKKPLTVIWGARR